MEDIYVLGRKVAKEVGGSYRMSNMLEEASSASSLQLILNSTKFEQKTVHRINYKLLGVHYRCQLQILEGWVGCRLIGKYIRFIIVEILTFSIKCSLVSTGLVNQRQVGFSSIDCCWVNRLLLSIQAVVGSTAVH